MGGTRRWAMGLLLAMVALLTACTAAVAKAPPTVPATAHLEGPPLELTAMTYNVLGGPVPDDWFPMISRSELTPVTRAPGIVEKVRTAAPDVAALQEFAAGSEAAEAIKRGLQDYAWIHGPDNHALLVRSSRFDVVTSGDRRLNNVGEQGAVLDRYVDWARLRDRSTGRTLLVLNVHAHPFQTPEMAAVRSLAIGRLVEVIRELDPGLAEPLVLMGDFNAGNASTRPVFRDHLTGLAELGLVDAKKAARRDVSDVPGANSLNKMTATVAGQEVAKAVRRTGRYIDYVWVPKGTLVRSWQVLSGPGVTWQRVRGERVPVWTGIIPSDHSPVVAVVRFG